MQDERLLSPHLTGEDDSNESSLRPYAFRIT